MPFISVAAELSPPLVDLEVVQPPPIHSFVDEERIISVIVANRGGTESEPTEMMILVDGPDPRPAFQAVVPPLGPGTSHAVDVILHERRAGIHPIRIVVDPEQRLAEANERNNVAAVEWTVEEGLDGWCCLDKRVYGASEMTCDRRHGDFQIAREDAERTCRNEGTDPGWCCSAEGDVLETGDLACRIVRGALFAKREQAEDLCAAASLTGTDGDAGPFAAIEDRGPEKPGGRMIALDAATKASGANAKVRYAAAPWGGVWRSDDRGAVWYQLTQPQPKPGHSMIGGIDAYSLRDLVVSPTNPNIVLVAGYDNVRKSQASRSGIYRSTNGGQTWSLVKQFKWQGGAIAEVGQIRFAPDNAKLVFAAHGSGVSYSEDAGGKWTTVAFPDAGPAWTERKVWHIAIAPEEDDGGRRVYACGDGSVWYSMDAGQNWTRDRATILPAGHTHCGAPNLGVGRSAQVLEVEPGQPDHVYLAYRHLANGPRYFKKATSPQGTKVLLKETDGHNCGTSAPLSAANQTLFGQQNVLLGCGEGSLWLGDFSKFDTKATSPTASWTKMEGPPVYWGGSTPSGRTYVKVQETKSGYLLFFSDRSHVHVSVGRPQAGAWHRLDGDDISATYRTWQKNPKIWGNRLRMHVDPHALWVSADFDFTLKAPTGVPAPYDKNRELDKCLGGEIAMANDGGVYASTDCGKTWNAAKDGPDTIIVVNLAGLTDAYVSPALYFGTGDNDDFYSLDGGGTWADAIGTCSDCDRWYFDAADPEIVYELGYPGRKGPFLRVYRSPSGGFPDAGRTGNARLAFLPYPQPTFFDDFDTAQSRPVVVPLAGEAPLADGAFVIIERQTDGTRRIVKANAATNLPDMKHWTSAQISQYWSTHGNAWTPILTLPAAATNARVLQVAGGQRHPTFFVSDGTRLWKSNPAIAGWKTPWQQVVPSPATTDSAGATMVRRVFVNPYDPNDITIIDLDAVKHSSNGGTTWGVDTTLDKLITRNGTIAYGCWSHYCVINDMVFDRDNTKRRFAMGSGGVFSSDDGQKWRSILDPSALACRPVSGVYDRKGVLFDPALYVGCYGRGILKLHHEIKRIYPDILLARPPLIDRIIPDERLLVRWRLFLKNAGLVDIDEEIQIDLALDGELVRKELAPPLAAGEVTEYEILLEVGRGDHTLTITLDGPDLIQEWDEENNVLVHRFSL